MNCFSIVQRFDEILYESLTPWNLVCIANACIQQYVHMSQIVIIQFYEKKKTLTKMYSTYWAASISSLKEFFNKCKVPL